MASVKKKKPDIKKRTNTKMSKSVKKIKDNENKYTFLLVLFFMLLFIVIGYFTLRVQAGTVTNISNIEAAIT